MGVGDLPVLCCFVTDCFLGLPDGTTNGRVGSKYGFEVCREGYVHFRPGEVGKLQLDACPQKISFVPQAMHQVAHRASGGGHGAGQKTGMFLLHRCHKLLRCEPAVRFILEETSARGHVQAAVIQY